MSRKGEDEGGEMSFVVVIVEPVGDNVGERGGRETLVDTSGRVRDVTSTIKIRLTLDNTLV